MRSKYHEVKKILTKNTFLKKQRVEISFCLKNKWTLTFPIRKSWPRNFTKNGIGDSEITNFHSSYFWPSKISNLVDYKYFFEQNFQKRWKDNPQNIGTVGQKQNCWIPSPPPQIGVYTFLHHKDEKRLMKLWLSWTRFLPGFYYKLGWVPQTDAYCGHFVIEKKTWLS